MKKVIISFLISILFISCSISRSTVYTNKSIEIGASKEFILKKFGKPFKESLSKEKDDIIEIVCYKESVYVKAYEYIISTYFYFKNHHLFKKEQKEEKPPYRTDIKVK